MKMVQAIENAQQFNSTVEVAPDNSASTDAGLEIAKRAANPKLRAPEAQARPMNPARQAAVVYFFQ